MFYSHGFGDHCGRYHEFAQLWTNNSFAFFCLDHQGACSSRHVPTHHWCALEYI
jgi:alpha-beta hydrolase superfamily lysophospholipase